MIKVENVLKEQISKIAITRYSHYGVCHFTKCPYAEWCYAKCRYYKWYYVKCQYSECHNVQCGYAETLIILSVPMLKVSC